MTSDALLTMVRARPFEPFLIQLADGERVPVPHPESIAHTPGSRRVFVALMGEDFRLIDLQSVASIATIAPTP